MRGQDFTHPWIIFARMALHSSYSFMSKYENVKTILPYPWPWAFLSYRLASSIYTCHHIFVSTPLNMIWGTLWLCIITTFLSCWWYQLPGLTCRLSSRSWWCEKFWCGRQSLALSSQRSQEEKKTGVNIDLFPSPPPSKLCPKLVFNFHSSALSVFSSKF